MYLSVCIHLVSIWLKKWKLKDNMFFKIMIVTDLYLFSYISGGFQWSTTSEL